MKLLLILVAVLGLSSAQQREICNTNDQNPYVKFATKTAYEFVKGRSSSQTDYVPNCDPIMFWSLNRHGVTYLDEKKAFQMQDLVETRNLIVKNYEQQHTAPSEGRLCYADIQSLKSWTFNQTDSSIAGQLTYTASWDTVNLAKTWKTKYPQLFTNNPQNYLFLYANDQVSQRSYKAFADGVLGVGPTQSYTTEVPSMANERNLRPYMQCPVWERKVKNNNDTMEQVKIYKSKEEFKSMLQNVTSRLGFQYPIDAVTIEKMYEMCRLNKAWDITKTSPWCAAFTRQDLEMWEYVEDLKSYYTAGYGNNWNVDLGCTMIKDFMDYFSNFINKPDQQQPTVRVQFTDSAMILMTLTAMGAFKDPIPLTADNYHNPRIQRRQWRTSVMDPYNANIVAVLYRCRFDTEQYKVSFYLNEQPIDIEGCQVGLCGWNQLRNKYNLVAEKCNLYFCDRNSAVRSATITAFIIAPIAILINYLF